MTRRITLALIAAAAACALVAPAANATFLSPAVADGPSPDIAGLGGLDMAHDGTGSLVYLKHDGDGIHVFASRMIEGAPQPPVRVDAGQAGDASSAQVAVGDGDRAVVTWINGGALWASTRFGPTAPWSPPAKVFGPPDGAAVSDPSLDMSLLGTAYVSFTVGGDVRVARMPYGTPNAWTVLPSPVDVDPSRLAAHSDLAASADGSAIIAWTETGPAGDSHVFVRRVNDDGSLSAFPREASVPSLDGRPGGNADTPSISVQDASSWAFVAFRQDFVNGGVTQSRAVGRRFVASQFEPARAIDNLAWGAPDGADHSQIFIGGRGWGSWVTALRSGVVSGGGMERTGDIGVHWYAPHRMDPGGNTPPTPITTTMSEAESGIVAWQQAPPGFAPTVIGRHWDTDHFEAITTLSPGVFGPTDAQLGIASGADGSRDFVVGFVQGDPANRRIVTVTYDGPLRPAAIPLDDRWKRQRRPKLTWRGLPKQDVIWGPVSYRVDIDGVPATTTTHTSWRPPKPLPDGAHDIEIVQIDGRGGESPGIPRTRRIDTHGPRVTLKRSHGAYRLSVSDGTAIQGSGVASVRVRLAHGSVSIRVPKIGIVQGARVRGRPVRIVAVDKVGNKTSVSAKAASRKGGAP